MPILTEESLRSLRLPDGQRELQVMPGTVCSPSALDYLAAREITLTFSDTSSSAPDTQSAQKPEHLTHLRADELVLKSHPVITFRGEMDVLFALLAESGAVCVLSKRKELCAELAEILDFSRNILLCEVTGEQFCQTVLLGRSLDDYRMMSHDTRSYFGFDHPVPKLGMAAAALRLNTIRTQVRRAELAAARAFLGDGNVEREDIITALNRLSSVIYVLFCLELKD